MSVKEQAKEVFIRASRELPRALFYEWLEFAFGAQRAEITEIELATIERELYRLTGVTNAEIFPVS